MDHTISKVDNENIDSINAEVSTEDNKAKYYEYNDKNCTFEILEDDKVKNEEVKLNINGFEIENNLFENGEIVVKSVLDCGENECLQGVKINLYKINGLTPILITSKITDEDGRVVFSEVEEGCYRIIEIVDKRYFEKPKYISWNEIIIDSVNKNQKIKIVNRIKRGVPQDKHRHCI
jgi:5-hydroxyisourate hydrolase-like protein (transthyretin family)